MCATTSRRSGGVGARRLWSATIVVLACLASTTITTSVSAQQREQREPPRRRKRFRGGNDRRRGLRDANAQRLPAHVQGGPAVAVLTTRHEKDVEELCLALRSLRFLRGDGTANHDDHEEDSTTSPSVHRAPVLVFNEGDLTPAQMEYVDSCTDRTVAFPFVELNAFFPKGFDPEAEWETFAKGEHYFKSLPGRARWSYAQMIRFWTTGIWKHPAIQQFDTIMRIDTDSCFLDPALEQHANPSLAPLPALRDQFVYQSINPPHGKSTYVQGLYDFAKEYMAAEGLEPSHPALWATVEEAWNGPRRTLPVFKTNFENARRAFFQSPKVLRWHEALTEREPFGVWRRRWGDAQTRFLTMAMFGTPATVDVAPDKGYAHGRGRCVDLLGDDAPEPEGERVQQ